MRFKYNIRCKEKIHLIFKVQFYSKFRRYELIFSKLGRFKLCGGKCFAHWGRVGMRPN